MFRSSFFSVTFLVTTMVMLLQPASTSAQIGAASPGGIHPPDVALKREVSLKRIEGTVVNSVTGEPVRRAVVSLSGTAQRAAFTDDEGRFAFDKVQPGPLMLQARKPGFLAPHDRPALFDSSKSAGPVEIKLVPAGVLYGQVIGADDEPLERTPIQLFESTISEGRRRWVNAGMKLSDEDGRFRIPDLKPGMYKISAGPLRRPALDSPDVGYALTYYANSPDRASSSTIQLAPAQQVEINFILHPVRVYKVSGMVVGGTQRGPNLELFDSSEVRIMVPMRFDFSSGSFEATVPAGKYSIRAMSMDDKGRVLRAKTTISVGANITGVLLNLQPAITVPVIVHREFARPVQMQGEGVASAGVRLVSVADPNVGAYSMPNGPSDNGSIVIPNVEPGTYDVEVMPQMAWGGSMYIASVRCGSRNLMREPLTVTGEEAVDPIEIEIRDDGATLEGTVHGSTGDGQLVIVSETDRKRRVLGNYGSDGHLYAPALPPGAYTIYAFDHPDEVEFGSPEVLRHYESKAAHITLSSNQAARVTVDLIETEQ